jgi:diguanylate cyclase (GGDEF)-like protein
VRGDPHPSVAGAAHLTAARRPGSLLKPACEGVAHGARGLAAGLQTAAGRAWAFGALTLLIVLLTGITASPLLPILAVAVAAVIRYDLRRFAPAAAPAAAAALLAAEWLAGHRAISLSAAALVAAAAILLAAVPGLLWRRDARRAGAGLGRRVPAARSAPTGPGVADVAVPTDPSADAASPPRVVPTAAEEQADLEVALEAVAERIGAVGVTLWTVDGYTAMARVRTAAGPLAPGSQVPASGIRLPGDPLGWAWDQGMRLRLEQPPRWAERGTSVTIEPLRRRDEHGELLTCAFPVQHGPAGDLPLDEAAVYVRGVLALQEARSGAAAAQRRLDTLVAGLQRLPGELDVDTLAADLCGTACSLTEATGAAIGFWDGDEGEVLGVAGADGGPRPGDAFVPPYSELALAVRADTTLVRQAGEWALGRTCVAHHGERWTARPRAMAVLPLRGTAGTIGVLAVWTSRRGALDPQGLEALQGLSPYAALHLEHARAFGHLREHAERDPLTLLRNRRAFERLLAAETDRFERYRRPLAMVVLDLDHFKAINDQHGHEAGDEVLRSVARTLAACIRDVDTAARLGGEEFVVLLPETALAAAVEVADRIRTAVAAAPVAWRTGLIPVTLSAGAAACPETVPLPEELMGVADRALYRAKHDGRNRVAAAEPGGG